MPTNITDEKWKNRIEALGKRINALMRETAYASKGEERFQTVFNSTKEIYFEVDLKGDLTYFNPALCLLSGYSPDELMGKNNREYTTPETAKRMYKIFNRLYRTGGSAQITNYKIFTKDGSPRYLELSAYLISDNKGRPVGFQGLGRDVTQRISAEKALKESEERFRLLNEASFTGIFIHDKGRILDCNSKMVRMSGYSYKELIGMDGLKLCIPEHRKKVKDNILSGQEGPYDFLGLRKDGRRIPFEIRAKTIPYHGKKFRVAEFRDVTEQKKAEAALRRSRVRYRQLYKEAQKTEELYQSLLNSSADAIVLLDVGQKVRYVNPAFTRIFGWTLHELQGRQIPYVPKPLQPSMPELVTRLIEEGDPVHGYETQRYTRDKRLLDISISASRYLDDTGEPAGVLLILRDISEAKKYRWHMEQAQRMESIGTLAGGMAHDFNNLLMGVQGRLSLLLLNMDPSDPHCKYLKEIEDYVIRAADLTQRLLGIARGGKHEPRVTDINNLINSQNRMFERTRREVVLHEDFQADLLPVEVDQRQIEQVILNLYLNASQAMPGGGNLFVKTQNVHLDEDRTTPYDALPGRYVLVSVTDTGTGMDEATRKRIFEPFFTTKKRGHGTGLGLASAYSIIKNHGGFITVYSEKGEGTSFNIYLPASTGGLPSDKAVLHDEIIEGEGTVLLVDDEEMIRDIGEEMLSALGYNALLARNGKEAVDMYTRKQDQIDLVILDLIMPEMSGTETFDRLKSINPGVKILLSSGYSINGQADSIMKRGCNGFIQKPFNIQELSKRIDEIIVGPASA